jgi:hypothetical protein
MGQCVKTPEEFAEAMKGKETFALKRSPGGSFILGAPKKRIVPRNVLWPEITNAEEADHATKMGSGAATVIAAVTAIIATVTVFTNAPILGINATAYIDVTIFAFIAWGIRCRSNFVAVAGLVIFALDKGHQFWVQPKSLAGLTVSIFLFCGFISGVRGTRAYWRFEPERAAAQARSFKLLWKTPGIWMTLVLSGLAILALGLHLLQVLQAFLHPQAPGAAGPAITAWGYTRTALVMTVAAAAIFAIARRPHWGRLSCIVFAILLAASWVWLLTFRVSIDETSGVMAWAFSVGFLFVYLCAICLSEGVEEYFIIPKR